MPQVARAAADAGIAGLEFLRGVPGTIGGALKMNAGCYGREIKDIFVEATALDARGNHITLTPADMGFVYRKAQVRDELIFVEAVFEGTLDKPDAIRARMEELNANREASQPIRSKTGGSTFKNPPGHKAWQLIDEAGCRGLQHGRRPGQRETRQFPDQSGRRQGRRYRGAGRRSAQPRQGQIRHRPGMGNQAGGRMHGQGP